MIRITGGKYRGRSVQSPKKNNRLPEVRPTTGLIRESIFNRLQPVLLNARFFDCFAGSGIMGIEALSRGAAFVLATEKNREHAATIRKSIEQLPIEKEHYTLVQQDILTILAKQNKQAPFDIVFADPPYTIDSDGQIYLQLLECLLNNVWLAANATVLFEHHKNRLDTDMLEKLTGNLNLSTEAITQKNFGDSSLTIIQL